MRITQQQLIDILDNTDANNVTLLYETPVKMNKKGNPFFVKEGRAFVQVNSVTKKVIDTFGFGLTTIHTPGGKTAAYNSIVFYYDVPLDVDYTINEPLRKVEAYLTELGFVKNKYGEFNKGNIWVAPTDSSLDLVIYIWKTREA